MTYIERLYRLLDRARQRGDHWSVVTIQMRIAREWVRP